MAAAMPPKTVRFKNEAKLNDKNKSTMASLLQMGFSKHRAEKAIAATGNQGAQAAADWLLSHSNDCTLDQKTCQEYILYLCPVGPLQKQLADYFERTKLQCGWNGAHAYFPHITLCHFFKAEHNRIPYLTKALNRIQEKLLKAPGHLELEFFSQVNFIGLFVHKDYYDFLEDIVAMYAEEIRKVGVIMDPHRQQLHMTLAYQYDKEQHERLLKFAKEVDLNADVKWELRLYSRDSRAGECEVRKVTRSCLSPTVDDELEIFEGDYILADPHELSGSKNGWCKGISTVNGNIGMFRIACTARASETSTWTLHKSLPVVPVSNMFNGVNEGDYDNLWLGEQDEEFNKVLKTKKTDECKNTPREPRHLFVMRHGERCDFALGRDWVDSCFNSAGRYNRINLNLPKLMLKRKNYLDFIKDCPLTEVGKLQARLTGEGLRDASVNLSHLFVSPALRCIQTAHEIITALGLKIKLCIEPSIFEWLGWYQLGLPIWFTADELIERGYSVDRNYVSYMVPTQLYLDETVEHYYSRCADFTRYILKKHEPEGGNILIVGHAGSLDVCTRQLLGKAPRSVGGFHEILPYVPCCSMCCCVEDPITKKWKMKEPPVPPITHVANKKYNWKTLI